MSELADRRSDVVTVAVCTYSDERFELLVNTLQSLQQQTRLPTEIIVMVDHNPRLAEKVSERFPALRVLESTASSRGLSGARNSVMECAVGKVVAFVDDDATADVEWLSTLLDAFSDPHVLVAGSSVVPRWAGQPPRWFPEEFGWVLGCSYRGQVTSNNQQPVRNVIGNGMAVIRSAMDVGPFRTDLGRLGTTPLGCEETEWCIRVGQRFPDAKIVQVPAARLYHHVPLERARPARFLRHCYNEGLSKAIVAQSVGRAATASERRYSVQTLPTGVLRRLRDGSCGEPWQFVQAAAICAGFTCTVAGYLVGRCGTPSAWRAVLTPWRRVERSDTEGSGTAPDRARVSGEQGADEAALLLPTRASTASHDAALWTGVYDVESGHGVEPVSDVQPGSYERARILIRRGPRLLGFADVSLVEGKATEGQLRSEGRRLSSEAVSAAPSDDPYRLVLPTPRLVDTDMHFTVAVCTRDRPRAISRCLDSLRQIRYPHFQVLIVDNAPSDTQTRHLVERVTAQDSRFRYLREPHVGASNARNRALSESAFDHVAMTDDDVVVDRWWLHAIAAAFQANPRVACVTGMTASARLLSDAERYFDGRIRWSTRLRPVLYDIEQPPPDQPLFPYQAWTFGASVNCAFDRSYLAEIGGFDPCLGPGTPTDGGEDLDLFVRVLRAGGRIVYQPTALVWHFHRADSTDLHRQLRSYGRGLAALSTKWLSDRATRGELLRLATTAVVPLGRSWLRSAMTEPHGEMSPRGLVAVELLGALSGPGRYWRARLEHRVRGDIFGSRTTAIGGSASPPHPRGN